MAKTTLEKQLEKQIHQEKQLADRKRREEQQAERKRAEQARKDANRERAATIISSQKVIDGFRILDATAEEVLSCLLKCELQSGNGINFTDNIFPDYLRYSSELELEKLVQYGMVANVFNFIGGGMLNLLPPALTYFDDKKAILQKESEHKDMPEGTSTPKS